MAGPKNRDMKLDFDVFISKIAFVNCPEFIFATFKDTMEILSSTAFTETLKQVNISNCLQVSSFGSPHIRSTLNKFGYNSEVEIKI